MSIPNYLMQAFVFPVGVCEEIERLCRNFIWGSSSERKKLHLIAWSKIFQPKKVGGLGFKTLKLVNEAYMVKLRWRMVNQPHLLWVQAVRAKYKYGDHKMPQVKNCYRESSLWKGIYKAWNHVQAGVVWNIGNGKSTRFWSDTFIHGLSPLSNYAFQPSSVSQDCSLVASFASNGSWNLEILQTSLPPEVIEKLNAITPPRENLEDDSPTWADSSDGEFHLKNMYEKLGANYNSDLNEDLCQAMWKWQGPPESNALCGNVYMVKFLLM
ncbi:ribonuclease H [Sesbania bispinosa]|nr:ribonuclease H [Sesbania bispinosa]